MAHVYRLLRPLLFRLDAERAHELTLAGLRTVSRSAGLLRLLGRFSAPTDRALAVTAFGTEFRNPLLLAAGMDKNAVAIPGWAALGFGGVEIGTVTNLAQKGNPRPRLFRLPADQAVINRMGFNNDGAARVGERLARLERAALPPGFRLGINVGKSLATELDRAADDYLASLKQLWQYADYVVLNVSSPNTPGLRQLQDHDRLAELLALSTGLRAEDHRPLLLKIAPDLSDEALADVCSLAESYGLDGLIISNTTIGRPELAQDPGEAGGLSGQPLRRRSLTMLRQARQLTDLPLVAAGGIMTPADAVERIRAGAQLLQLYSGLVYSGPALVRGTLLALLMELEREGAESVSDLVGLDA